MDSSTVPAKRRWRWLTHPVGLLAVAAVLGLAAGVSQWVAAGVTESVVTEYGTFPFWKQTRFDPDVRRMTNGTFAYTCADGQQPGTRLPGSLTATDILLPPNPQQVPESVACFEYIEGTDAQTGERFRGPVWNDLLVAVVVALSAYFLAVAFILSFHALRRIERP